MARIYQARTVRSILRDHDRQLKVQGSASVLARSGFSVPAEGVTASPNFVAGSTGFAFYDNGNAEFNDLTLRGGIIGNEALSNPVAVDSAYDYVTNFSLSTTLTNIRTKTFVVPAGFTTAAVSLTVRVYAVNNTAGLDYLYSQANINGFNGLALPTPASGSNGSGMNVSTFSTVLTGTNLGSTLTLQIAAQTSFAGWAANASNAADLSASIGWYR